MLQSLWNSRIQCAAVILFAIGFSTLLLNRNLIKKIIGLNIMDTAVFLFLTSIGYIRGKLAPIVVEGVTSYREYVNPIPAGLVLTGIVVSVSVSAFSLALIQRIYGSYGTVDMRALLEAMKKRGE